MGTKERRAKAKEDVRALILDAARELFAQQGIEAVTMRQIAAKIDYTPTAIYFHFRDKQALLRELCNVDLGHLMQAFSRTASVGDPVKRLRAIATAYIDFGLNYPNHYRLLTMTMWPVGMVDPEMMEQRGDPSKDAYAFLCATSQAVIDGGFARAGYADAELFTQTLWAGVHGMIALEIVLKDDPWFTWRPIKKRAKAMVDVLLAGLLREVPA